MSLPGRFGGGTTGGWTTPFTGSIYGSLRGGGTSPPSGLAFAVSYYLKDNYFYFIWIKKMYTKNKIPMLCLTFTTIK